MAGKNNRPIGKNKVMTSNDQYRWRIIMARNNKRPIGKNEVMTNTAGDC
jgi:hypothetical protein